MRSIKRVVLFAAIVVVVFVRSTYASGIVFEYDNLHRLTQIERSDGAVIIYTYDNLGNRTSKTATASIAGGDLNGDGRVDLSDVILSLQIVSGTEPLGTISTAADVNDDGQIGIEETIFMMREVSGL